MSRADDGLSLAIVVAVGRNGAIGYQNRLPWHMPSDLARFRHLTMGKPMIMGRRTFQSIGRALPGRESIVVSGSALDLPAGVLSAATPDEAVDLAGAQAKAMGAEAIMLIGGVSLFTELMPRVDRLHMTFVEMAPPADRFFPPVAWDEWREVSRRSPPRDPRDDAACVFVDYTRI